MIQRRQFVKWTATAIGTGTLATVGLATAKRGRADDPVGVGGPEQPREVPRPVELAGPADLASADDVATAMDPTWSGPGWLGKTLKNGMIRVSGDWDAKFETAMAAGFQGVEIQTGDLDVDAIVRAATSMPIDGTVGGYHWKIRHTDPDASVREEAQRRLTQSLQQTADLGANTFLIVPGHGKDGTPGEVRQRAFTAIEKAVPLAEKLGVEILIENVWNHFLYDHDGDSNQSAQPLADFIDSFGSPVVGCQFDLGNHWKYGDVAQWVRTLDHRIKKLDIKGFSRVSGGFTDITEGDIDWPSVRAALVAINFTGWLAAEVRGGDVDRLTTVAGQMESAMRCTETMAAMRKAIG